MKKITYLYLFFSLLITSFTGCFKDIDGCDDAFLKDKPSLKFTADTIYVGKEGGYVTLMINSNTEWGIINSQENQQKNYYSILNELSNYTGNGSIVVSFTENNINEDRIIVQEIKSANSALLSQVCIIQVANGKEILEFANDTVYVAKEGGNVTLDVLSTLRWSLKENPDNQNKPYYSIVSGQGEQIANGSVVVNLAKNETGVDRVVEQEVYSSDLSKSAKITIIQAGDKISSGVFATIVEKDAILIERRSYQTSTTYNILATYRIISDIMYESTISGITRLYFEAENIDGTPHQAKFYLRYDSSQYPDLGLNQLKELVLAGYKDVKIYAPYWSSKETSLGQVESFNITQTDDVIYYNFVDNNPKGTFYTYYFHGALKFKFAQ